MVLTTRKLLAYICKFSSCLTYFTLKCCTLAQVVDDSPQPPIAISICIYKAGMEASTGPEASNFYVGPLDILNGLVKFPITSIVNTE